MNLVGRGSQDVADAAPVAQTMVHHRDEAHQERVARALLVTAAGIPVFFVQPCEVIAKSQALWYSNLTIVATYR